MVRHVTTVRNNIHSRACTRKKVRGLAQEEEHERDLDLTLFVGAVTTEFQIKNDECYVKLPPKDILQNSRWTLALKLTSCHLRNSKR